MFSNSIAEVGDVVLRKFQFNAVVEVHGCEAYYFLPTSEKVTSAIPTSQCMD